MEELVIDNDFVNRTFARGGGSQRLGKLLEGKLEEVMSTLVLELWPQAI